MPAAIGGKASGSAIALSAINARKDSSGASWHGVNFPVLARAFPSARVPPILAARVPSRPAIGSDASNGPLSRASRPTWLRIITSASGVTKS